MLLRKLRGRIIERFGTLGKFATEMGISNAALTLRLNCKIEWKLTEVAKACRLLDIPDSEITAYFLANND